MGLDSAARQLLEEEEEGRGGGERGGGGVLEDYIAGWWLSLWWRRARDGRTRRETRSNDTEETQSDGIKLAALLRRTLDRQGEGSKNQSQSRRVGGGDFDGAKQLEWPAAGSHLLPSPTGGQRQASEG